MNSKPAEFDDPVPPSVSPWEPRVSILTGGHDRPYVTGLVSAITCKGLAVDLIGSDVLRVPELLRNPMVRFLNLRGSQCANVGVGQKVARVIAYYCRLISYTIRARPQIFHVLWNNKFEVFDRTLLMAYYKVTGKHVVLTAHNVNMRKRDGTDNRLNRLTLKIQYGLADHVFVHSERMKTELMSDFGVTANRVTVIPFGINNTVPITGLTRDVAKSQLGLSRGDKALLCFGRIAPYKGLEYLIGAMSKILECDRSYRLIIAGEPKSDRPYWNKISQLITRSGIQDRVVTRIEHVSDEETEVFFKAADIAILPYTNVFQSGVLFLAYAFGLPVIAAGVGGLKDEIIEGRTGYVFKPRDSADLAKKIELYFKSELFLNLDTTRADIREYANEKYSWNKVSRITTSVYTTLLRNVKGRDAGSGKVTE